MSQVGGHSISVTPVRTIQPGKSEKACAQPSSAKERKPRNRQLHLLFSLAILHDAGNHSHQTVTEIKHTLKQSVYIYMIPLVLVCILMESPDCPS